MLHIHISLSLSLSLYIYVCIYIYIYTCIPAGREVSTRDASPRLSMVVPFVSAVFRFPFCRSTVLPFWHYALFIIDSRFRLCRLSQHTVSEIMFSVSQAALRPISLLALSLLTLLDSNFSGNPLGT